MEEEESSLSRISFLWQCSLEKQAEPLSSKWKGSLRWKLPSNQVTDIYLIPSVAGLSLKLPKSTLISLDPSKCWIVMAFNQRRLWFLKTSANIEISACGTVTYSCTSVLVHCNVAEEEHATGILAVKGKSGEGSYQEWAGRNFRGRLEHVRAKKGASGHWALPILKHNNICSLGLEEVGRAGKRGKIRLRGSQGVCSTLYTGGKEGQQGYLEHGFLKKITNGTNILFVSILIIPD